MSLLAPDIRDLAARVPVDGINPELSFAMSALGGVFTIWFLLNARIERVELAHKLMAARGR